MTDQPTQSKRDVVEGLLKEYDGYIPDTHDPNAYHDTRGKWFALKTRILSIVDELERENGELKITLGKERFAWKRIADTYAVDKRLFELAQAELATLRSRGEGETCGWVKTVEEDEMGRRETNYRTACGKDYPANLTGFCSCGKRIQST